MIVWVVFFRAGADFVSSGGCNRACLFDRTTFKNEGGTDDQGFQVGNRCRIDGRGDARRSNDSHGIRIARRGERCEGAVARGGHGPAATAT